MSMADQNPFRLAAAAADGSLSRFEMPSQNPMTPVAAACMGTAVKALRTRVHPPSRPYSRFSAKAKPRLTQTA